MSSGFWETCHTESRRREGGRRFPIISSLVTHCPESMHDRKSAINQTNTPTHTHDFAPPKSNTRDGFGSSSSSSNAPAATFISRIAFSIFVFATQVVLN